LFSNLTKIDKLERFLKSYEDKPFIISELMNINKALNLNFSGNEIEKQGNNLFIIKNKEKILLYIKGIISIIEQFKLEKTDFYNNLINLIQQLNEEKFLENINEIVNDIAKFDIK
jgi:dissimilatory sulfite reductase (desulfoviridin) alpha/beta subunit